MMALESIRMVLPRVSTRMASGHGFDEPSFSNSLCNKKTLQIKRTFSRKNAKNCKNYYLSARPASRDW